MGLELVYVDSNVFIYPVIYDEAKVDKAVRLSPFSRR